MWLHLILLLLAMGAPASAEGLSTRLSQVDSGRFPTIAVTLGVFTDRGHPVPGLTRDDFGLAEDGVKVAVVSVEVEKAPLSIGLVLDLSGSMKPALESLKAAVVSFVRELDPSDRVMLLTFSDKPRLREDLTANRTAIQERVEALETENSTALYDAMAEVVSQLRRVQGRRLAVVFTDGRDQNAAGTAPQSSATALSVAKAARRAQVPLWTIGLGTQVDSKLLEKLSAVTGGRSYGASQASELRQAFGEVLAHVRLQYRLTYRTPREQRDGTVRKLDVTSAARGNSGQGSAEYVAPAPEAAPEPAPVAAAPQTGRGSLPAGQASTMAYQTMGGYEKPDDAPGQLSFPGYIAPGWVAGAWPAQTPSGAPFAQIDFSVTREMALPSGRWRLVVQDQFGRVQRDLDVNLARGDHMLVTGTTSNSRSSSVQAHSGNDPAPTVPIASSGEVEQPGPGPGPIGPRWTPPER